MDNSFDDQVKKSFVIIDHIDNFPIFLNNPENIIETFEFALLCDPFLHLRLLVYANLDGYGFENSIINIDEIPYILEKDILFSIINSSQTIDFSSHSEKNKQWTQEAYYYFLLFPVYLSITELLHDPFWLNSNELDILTLSPIGFGLKKLFFYNDYLNIMDFSQKKSISFKKAENKLNYPSANLILNAFLVKKNIPIIIPNVDKETNVESSKGKISFLLKLVDLLLDTHFYIYPTKKLNIKSYLQKTLSSIEIDFDKWLETLKEKAQLLWYDLFPEDLIHNILESITQKKNR